MPRLLQAAEPGGPDDPVARVKIHSYTVILAQDLPQAFAGRLRIALGSHQGVIAVEANVRTPAAVVAHARVLRLLKRDVLRAFDGLDARLAADPVLQQLAQVDGGAALRRLLTEGE